MSIQLPISAKERVEFTPERRKADEPMPVYLLRVPDVLDRTRFNARVQDEANRLADEGGLRRVDALPIGRAQMVVELRQAVEASGADTAADWLALLDRIAQVPADQPIADADVKPFTTLVEFMSANYEPFERVRWGAATWNDLAPAIAFQMFCIGWRNGPDGGNRIGRLSVAEQRLIPIADQVEIGRHAISLIYPSDAQAKN